MAGVSYEGEMIIINLSQYDIKYLYFLLVSVFTVISIKSYHGRSSRFLALLVVSSVVLDARRV